MKLEAKLVNLVGIEAKLLKWTYCEWMWKDDLNFFLC